ncbi:MAG TPA: hypothetical protein VKB94_03075 [Rhizomicrobium sp.]|nr:hypothetical protein [Rhizomicrobium sp.]
MKRALIWIVGILVAANLGLLFSGYGIRLKEKPCTYFIGFIAMGNYLRHDCPKFGKAFWALP